MHHVLRHRLRSLGAHVSSLRAILSNLPRLGLFRVEKVGPPSPFGNPYHIRRRISSIRQAPAKIGTKPKEGRGSARIRESEPYKEPSLSRGEDSLEAHSTESKSRQHTRFPFRRNSLPPSNFSFLSLQRIMALPNHIDFRHTTASAWVVSAATLSATTPSPRYRRSRTSRQVHVACVAFLPHRST